MRFHWLVMWLVFVGGVVCEVGAQNGAGGSPPAVTFTAEQDHQNMMDQLGIRQLRPGPSGDESAPNHANYDAAVANPFPNLPDPLMLNNGSRVTTAEMWWKQRRPEIVEAMESEVYGRIPKSLPKVTWMVKVTDKERVGRVAVIAKQLVGHVDNSSYPAKYRHGRLRFRGSHRNDVWAQRIARSGATDSTRTGADQQQAEGIAGAKRSGDSGDF